MYKRSVVIKEIFFSFYITKFYYYKLFVLIWFFMYIVYSFDIYTTTTEQWVSIKYYYNKKYKLVYTTHKKCIFLKLIRKQSFYRRNNINQHVIGIV